MSSPAVTGDVLKEVMKMMSDKGSAEQLKQVDGMLWQRENVGIKHNGKHIVLPNDPRAMTMEAAVEALQRKIKADNEVISFIENIEGYPFDAAVAFVKAMQRRYGWANPVPTPTFFGPKPPQMISVRLGPESHDVAQVPIGSFEVPGVNSRIETVIDWKGGFIVRGQIKNAEKAQLMELVADARMILEKETIYRGKALRLHVDSDGDIIKGMQPTFLHTKHVKPEELIFSQDVTELMETTIFTPIKHTEACYKHKIPLKRGILLAGPYGTGKSLTAAVCSKVCVENGWTFVLLDKPEGLRAGLEFAQRYQPAVLFAEDIDRVMEERDDDANDLLNTIDGVLLKDAKVITVVTTNHSEKINKAMLRPGRLDAVIQVLPPDAKAAERLVRLYARELIEKSTTLEELGKAIQGQIPATIREVVERSKLAMISRGANKLIEHDLLIASTGMQHHLELLNCQDNKKPSVEEALGIAMMEAIKKGSGGIDTDTAETISNISSMVDDIQDVTRGTLLKTGVIEDMVAGASNPGALIEEVKDHVAKVHTDVKKVYARVSR